MAEGKVVNKIGFILRYDFILGEPMSQSRCDGQFAAVSSPVGRVGGGCGAAVRTGGLY